MTDTIYVCTQDEFDLTIGRLDHVLSKLVLWGKAARDYPREEYVGIANMQTLKHHAEDMVSAGQKILECLTTKEIEGTPQPEDEPKCICGHLLKNHAKTGRQPCLVPNPNDLDSIRCCPCNKYQPEV